VSTPEDNTNAGDQPTAPDQASAAPDQGQTPDPAQGPVPAQTAEAPAGRPLDQAGVAHQILSSSWLMSLLALVVALLVGGVLIGAADEGVQRAAGYLFARPTDFFSAAWSTVSQASAALFQGAVFDAQATSFT